MDLVTFEIVKNTHFSKNQKVQAQIESGQEVVILARWRRIENLLEDVNVPIPHTHNLGERDRILFINRDFGPKCLLMKKSRYGSFVYFGIFFISKIPATSKIVKIEKEGWAMGKKMREGWSNFVYKLTLGLLVVKNVFRTLQLGKAKKPLTRHFEDSSSLAKTSS